MPELSERANAAVEAVAAAKDDSDEAKSLDDGPEGRGGRKELAAFSEAVGKLFGKDGCAPCPLNALEPNLRRRSIGGCRAQGRRGRGRADRRIQQGRQGHDASQAGAEWIAQRASQGARPRP